MDDIEDIFTSAPELDTRRPFKNKVTRKAPAAPAVSEELGVGPGLGKVFVKTYGCSHNISDSEYMAGMLADYGY